MQHRVKVFPRRDNFCATSQDSVELDDVRTLTDGIL